MEHHFDIQIAAEYGMLEAVLINHFKFWINKNAANNVHFHDGYYWTYNSIKALQKLFPYATERQIRYALQKLEEKGVVKVGNYNKVNYDQTKWYTLDVNMLKPAESRENTDLTKLSNGSDKIVNSNLQNCQMEVTKLSNGSDKIVRPIPYNYTYNKPYNNTYAGVSFFDNEEINKMFSDYLEQLENNGELISGSKIEYLLKDLETLAKTDDEKKEIIKNAIVGNWKMFYPLTVKKHKTKKMETDRNYNYDELEKKLLRGG